MKQKKTYFSIVVPTFNRSRQLNLLLLALVQQDYPKDQFEVIVIDDGSAESPESLVYAFKDRLHITLIGQNHNGPAMARNRGVSAAKGEYVVFTDDDCFPVVDWLEKLAKCFRAFPNYAVGGRTINGDVNNPYAISSQMVADFLCSFYNRDPDYAQFLISNNLAMPKEKFRTIGGFNPEFAHPGGEDRDLCRRLLQDRTRLIYAPDILVIHHHQLNLKTFWKQHHKYGRGAYMVRKRMAESNQNKLGIESFLFYMRLLIFPFSQRISWKHPSVFFLIVISQIATAAGFFREYLDRKNG